MRGTYLVVANIAIVAIGVRVAAVFVGTIRTLKRRKRLATSRFGVIEALLAPEPIVLGLVSYVAFLQVISLPSTPIALARAVAGATLSLLCLALLFWTLASWRDLFVGHAVVTGQRLVTDGAFGLVRHPVYLGVIFAWLGGAVAFGSWPLAALLVLYVVPGYVLYARSEEKMMLAAFGDEYEAYRQKTPMLIPGVRARRPVSARTV